MAWQTLDSITQAIARPTGRYLTEVPARHKAFSDSGNFMTTVRTLTILLIATFLLDSCSQRDDILLSASDELHYIHLFDKNSEFELCHNGFNTAVGKYEFKDDTIYLTYTGRKNEFLTRKLIIDNATKRIHSADESNFCAFITSNKLKSN